MNFNSFYQQISQNRLSHWLTSLPAHLEHWHNQQLHGEFYQWQKSLNALPKTAPSKVDLANGVHVGRKEDISDGEFKQIGNLLKKFKPIKNDNIITILKLKIIWLYIITIIYSC